MPQSTLNSQSLQDDKLAHTPPPNNPSLGTSSFLLGVQNSVLLWGFQWFRFSTQPPTLQHLQCPCPKTKEGVHTPLPSTLFLHTAPILLSVPKDYNTCTSFCNLIRIPHTLSVSAFSEGLARKRILQGQLKPVEQLHLCRAHYFRFRNILVIRVKNCISNYQKIKKIPSIQQNVM